MWSDGVGVSEWIVIVVVALLVVGPKDLPIVMRKLGAWTRKLRDMASDFRHNFDELARQSELDSLRQEIDSLKQLNPINDIKREIESATSLGENYMKPNPTPEYEFAKEEAVTTQSEAPKSSAVEEKKIKKPRKPRDKKLISLSDEPANNE